MNKNDIEINEQSSEQATIKGIIAETITIRVGHGIISIPRNIKESTDTVSPELQE